MVKLLLLARRIRLYGAAYALAIGQVNLITFDIRPGSFG
jgi:hypothetical protein